MSAKTIMPETMPVSAMNRAHRIGLTAFAALLIIGFQMVQVMVAEEHKQQTAAKMMLSMASEIQSSTAFAIETAMTGTEDEVMAMTSAYSTTVGKVKATIASSVDMLEGNLEFQQQENAGMATAEHVGVEISNRLDQLEVRVADLLSSSLQDLDPQHLADVSAYVELDIISRLIYLSNLFSDHAEHLDDRLGVMSVATLVIELVFLIAFATLVLAPLTRKAASQSEHVKAELEETTRAAFFDAETRLPNTNLLQSTVRLAVEENTTGLPDMALVMIRALVRNTFGDQTLVAKAVGIRLSSIGRKEFQVFRISDNVFAVLISQEGAEHQVSSVARAIRVALETPIVLGAVPVHLGISLGAAVLGKDTPDAAALLRHAEIATNHNRKASEGGAAAPPFSLFAPALLTRMDDDKHKARELAHALEAGQIVSYFQPQVDIATSKVIGFEALARWHHPQKGVLSPFHFLDISEASGLSGLLGETTVSTALRAFETWRQSGFAVDSIGLNFSESQLGNATLLEKLEWEADRLDIAPSSIVVEVLETVLTDSQSSNVALAVRKLADKGYQIDLDDFGTGSASIANIERFRANRLKIDRSFVADILENPTHRKLVAAMIGMSRSFDIEVLAEGVENQEIVDAVRDLGCTKFQGYHFGKPMALEDTIAWLDSWYNGSADKIVASGQG